MRTATYGYAKSIRMGHILSAGGGLTAVCGQRCRAWLGDRPQRVCRWCEWRSDPLARLMALVQQSPNGCWQWTGGVSRSNGYGRAWLDGNTVTAHSAMYRLTVGPVPAGREIDHLCHNRDRTCPGGKCAHRRCVNPDHLEAVTASTNQIRQGRRKTHCPHGHEYTPENTRYSGNSRICRACDRERYLRRVAG